MKTVPLTLCSMLLTLTLGMADARAQFEEMVKHIPDGANSIVLINADKVFESPIAKQQGWSGERETRFASGLTFLPPTADHMVIGAEFDLQSMQRMWTVGVVQSDDPPMLSTVARKVTGVLERINETPVVRLVDGSFLVEFPDGLRGAMIPANRQQVARWIGQSGGRLSPYLEAGVGFAEKQAAIILAIDLNHVVTADEVAHRMGKDIDLYQDLIKQWPAEPQQLAELLASVQGVTLGMTFGEKPYGKIKVDFGQDASQLEPIAKPLLLKILEHRGAMLEELSDWDVAVSGKQVTLGGYLTESGLLRLTSLIELPSHGMRVAPEQQADVASPAATDANNPSANDQPKTMLEATQQYYASVQRLLRDLQGRRGEARTMGTIAMWFGNYAQKIERLPLLNVDPEMLDYGQYVANQLRNGSLAMKGNSIASRPAQMAASSQAGGGSFGASAGGGWGYGYGSFYATGSSADYIMSRAAGNSPSMAAFTTAKMEVRQQEAARQQVRAQERAASGTSMQQTIALIQEADAKIRRDMTQKYQVNF